MPGGPKWCELLVKVYSTPFSTEIKVNKTDAVTVCLYRIFTFEQIILNPVTVANYLVVLTVLEDSCVVIFVHRRMEFSLRVKLELVNRITLRMITPWAILMLVLY